MDDTIKKVEILLVKDNQTDAKLTIRALKKSAWNGSHLEI